MNKPFTMSQSCLKAARKYIDGDLCGLLFKWEWVDVNENTEIDSEAMLLGQWFEYCLTGQRNYWGRIPEPRRIRNGDLSKPFQLAKDRALLVGGYLAIFKWNMVQKGGKHKRGDLTASTDIIITCGEGGFWPFPEPWTPEAEAVIDVKYSGLIGDKWNEMGFTLGNIQEGYHATQAIQYVHVTGIKNFAYLVTSSGKNMDCKIYPVVVGPDHIEAHLQEVKEVKAMIDTSIMTGVFKPIPTFTGCMSCPIRKDCKSKITVPTAESVTRLS